jgi:hypothetical protein
MDFYSGKTKVREIEMESPRQELEKKINET